MGHVRLLGALRGYLDQAGGLVPVLFNIALDCTLLCKTALIIVYADDVDSLGRALPGAEDVTHG
jgi:hypothetical protein